MIFNFLMLKIFFIQIEKFVSSFSESFIQFPSHSTSGGDNYIHQEVFKFYFRLSYDLFLANSKLLIILGKLEMNNIIE